MILPPFLAQIPASTPPPLRDIKPPLDVFPYPMWVVYTAAAALVLIIGCAVWLFVRWWRRRPAPPPPTAREIAVAALEEARAQIGNLDPYAFSILVSDILRRYVSVEYKLHATEQTSPEFLASIANIPSFTAAERSQLAEFLEKCDLIKFARMVATSEDSGRLLDQAIQFAKGGAQ
jgi:hypothetical protein